MIDLSSIYRNRRLPAGYYFAKVTDIDTEELGHDRPRIEVSLKIGHMHAEGGTQLSSIIHPTDAAIFWYKNFVSTFLIRGNRYHQAIGRWASIEVLDAKHGKTKYSAVKYVYQPLEIRLQTHDIEMAEQEGRLTWDEQQPAA